MKAETDLFLGAGLWLFGMAVMVGVALATPRFFTEGMLAGGLTSTLGIYIIWCACLDLFVDEYHDGIRKEWEHGNKGKGDASCEH